MIESLAVFAISDSALGAEGRWAESDRPDQRTGSVPGRWNGRPFELVFLRDGLTLTLR